MKKTIMIGVTVALLLSIALSGVAYIVFRFGIEDIFDKMLGGTSSLDFEKDGVSYVYHKRYGSYQIENINDSNNPLELKHIIIPDFINGYEVSIVGEIPVLWGMPQLRIHYSHTERIYFPWTVGGISEINLGLQDSDVLKYFVFSSNNEGIRYVAQDIIAKPMIRLIISNHFYKHLEPIYLNHKEFFNETYLPANISYMFNHAGNPNEGYFFIDLIEESGKIMKPPYDPRREGYTFLGWYKDEGCTEAWDFENDEVEIHFDEEGNRIYEEIKLYAGWEEQRDYGEKYLEQENILFLLNYEGAPNDGLYHAERKIFHGKIKQPSDPIRVGFRFDGWYKDEACTEAWDFKNDKFNVRFDLTENRIYDEIKLYAKWE